jgi:hypothetical protein
MLVVLVGSEEVFGSRNVKPSSVRLGSLDKNPSLSFSVLPAVPFLDYERIRELLATLLAAWWVVVDAVNGVRFSLDLCGDL